MRKQTWRTIVRCSMTLVLLVFAFVITPGTAFALKPVNETLLGKAIKGYDPVAYFTAMEAVKGKRAHTYKWMGATWYFANAEHQKLFEENPEKYAPQYGGYCAYAVSQGITADIDPQSWKVVDGKLYLNLSPSIKEIWEQDVPGYIVKADENWPKILQQ